MSRPSPLGGLVLAILGIGTAILTVLTLAGIVLDGCAAGVRALFGK